MRDFIPAIYQNDGVRYQAADEEESLFNCCPRILHGGEIAAEPRHEVTKGPSFTANNAADRGRGVTSFGGQSELYLDQDTYYYNGGSQDLTSTSAPGWAGNLGFNEEYTASFVRHRVSGSEVMAIVNAGHTSTHASANHGNLWYVVDGDTAPVSIQDADMPGNNGTSITRGGASLDGYFFLCDIKGQIYNSDLNDITAWSGDFLTAEREADIGVYLGRHHDSIVYIGTRSIEFFFNAGNESGSPLARRQDVSYRVGCYFPNTIVEVGDVIYFVGVEHDGHPKLYRLVNYQLEVLSNPKIEERMRDSGVGAGTFPDTTDLDSLTHSFWGSMVSADDTYGYILTFNFFWTYFFHIQTGVWTRWEFGASVTYPGGVTGSNWQSIFPIMSFNNRVGGGTVGMHQFINGTLGYFGTLDNDAIDDLGEANAPDVFIKFPRWDAGTDQKKRINWVRVITAPHSSPSTTVDPVSVVLKWFDYDRVGSAAPIPPDTEYTSSRTIDLNTRGARIGRLGTTHQRGFVVDFPTGHGPVAPVKGLEIDYEIVGQ